MGKASNGIAVSRRFIGTTPECSSSIGLLRGICNEIGEVYGDYSDVPVTFRELVVRFRELLGLATASSPLVLFLDAIDQTDAGDPAPVAQWLPKRLPPHCKIVVSTTEVHEALLEATLVRIDPFDEQEAEQVFERWLADGHRTLPDEQRSKVFQAGRPTGSPLYLRLAVEEAKIWRSFDQPEDCSLADSLPKMLEKVLKRLSQSTNHGPILVHSALGYLAAARYGLTESEILDVLTEDKAVWTDVVGEGERRHHDPPARRLPDIVWSRLFFDLRHFLHERQMPGGITIGLQDQQMAGSVHSMQVFHRGLACHFGKEANWISGQTGTTQSGGNLIREPHYRKVQELPYQLAHADLWPTLSHILTDLDFIEAKCAAGLSHDIVADYGTALSGRGLNASLTTDVTVLAEFRKFVSDEAVWLSLHPELTLQQAMNLPESLSPCKSAISGRLSAHRIPWMRRVNKAEERSFKAMLPSVGCRPVRGAVAVGERNLVIGDEMGFLSVYDLSTMTKLCELPLGDTVPTACCHGLTSGRVLVGTSDGTLLWVDLKCGAILGEWRKHRGAVLSLAVDTATGEVLSTSMDHSARIWKWRTDRLVSSEEIHRGAFPILCGTFVVDVGGVALGGADGRLFVLERTSGWSAIFSNWLHDGGISFCGATDSGMILWTAGSDNKISLTGVRRGQPVAALGSWKISGEILSFSTWQNSRSCIICQYGRILELPLEGATSVLNESQQSVCFASVLEHGEGVVAVEGDGSVYVLARKLFRRQEDRPARSVDALLWMPDGRRLCAFSEPETDGELYDIRSSPPLEAAIYDPDSNKFDRRTQYAGYFLSDAAICATAGYLLLRTDINEDECGVHVHDLDKMHHVGFLPTTERPRSLFVDSAACLATTVGYRGSFTVWSLETLTPRWSAEATEEDDGIRDIAFDLDRGLCLVVGRNNVYTFDLADGHPRSPDGGDDTVGSRHSFGWPGSLAVRYMTDVIRCGLTGDFRLLYSSSRGHIRWMVPEGEAGFLVLAGDGAIRYCTEDGDEVCALEEHTHRFVPIKSGRYVVSVSRSNTIRVWDPRTNTVVYRCPIHDEVTSICLHASKSLIAVGLLRGGIEVYDLMDGPNE